MERVKMAFEYAKKGTKGELSKREYKVAMTALFGHCPDNWEIKEIFQNCHERTVSYAEFLHWAREKGFGNDAFIDAKTLFILLDKDCEKRILELFIQPQRLRTFVEKNNTSLEEDIDLAVKGRLSITDFHSAAYEAGLRISKSVWLRAFNEMDRHKRGFLDLDDLTILMNNNIRTLTR